jgi:hypothetical protein
MARDKIQRENHVTATKSETPLMWFSRAHAYLFDAALLYSAKERPKDGHYEAPVWLLYFHAIEMFLKAYLRTKGLTDKELRDKYGHDLKKLIDEAQYREMPVTEGINIVRNFDAAKEFDSLKGVVLGPMQTRYPRAGRVIMLPAVYLHQAALDLQNLAEDALHAAGIATQRLPPIPAIEVPRQWLTAEEAARLLGEE